MTLNARTPNQPVPSSPQDLSDADSFRLVFEHSPVGVAIGRPSGEIVYVNETMCQLLGTPRADITVGTFINAAHPDHKLRVRVRLASLQSGEFQTFVRETRFQHADGTVVNARFHVSASRNPDGSIAYLAIRVDPGQVVALQ